MDDEERKRNAKTVVIDGTESGLGIRIVGGRNITSESEHDFGIFVKEVMANRLAERDGRLARGDQLLEANGQSLMRVSNETAVNILKGCAATGQIDFLVARDDKSKSDFRRLSNSLEQQQQMFMKRSSLTQGEPAPESALLPQPVAHSTPRVTNDDAEADSNVVHGRLEMYGGGAYHAADHRSSASSELTHISTTDISSHGEESDHTPFSSPTRRPPRSTSPTPPRPLPPTTSGVESPSNASSQVALSDVVVAVGSMTVVDSPAVVTTVQMATKAPSGSGSEEGEEASLGPPPPVPTTSPPDENAAGDQSTIVQPKEEEPTTGDVAMVPAGFPDTDVRRASPEGRSVSATPISPTFLTITFAKSKGLGVIIAGGVNRPNGPNILVEKVLEGMDASKDGRLQKGDRILAVNGESFANVTRERALTILTQIKIRPQVRSYTISFERPSLVKSPDDVVFTSTGPSFSLPTPPRTTTASIFDADTLPVKDVTIEPTAATSSVQADTLQPQDLAGLKESGMLFGEGSTRTSHTPLRYLTKKDTSGYDKTKYDSLHKRLSLDPNARIKLSKMQWALSYMGFVVTPEQQQQINSTLDIDSEGKVVFAAFVQLAREMFQFRLDDTHLEANLVMALTQKEGLDMPALPTKATSLEQLLKDYNPQLKLTSSLSSSQPSSVTGEPSGSLPTKSEAELELEAMRQQLHDLGRLRDQSRLSGAESELEKLKVENELNQQENARLQMLLKQRERETEHATMEKSPGWHKAENPLVLRKRLALAEAASRAARTKEHQLEETMQKMEEELSTLRTDVGTNELRKRLAVLGCQLKKEQAMSRCYQVATERLLQFVEACHEALVRSPEADRIMYHPHGKGESVRRGNVVTGNPRPPPYLAKHTKVTATTLAQEAQETIVAVRKMLQTEELPFGWEEAFTDDGEKYFIDHDNQTTTWVHPVTRETPGSAHTSRSSTPISHSRRTSRSSRASGTPEPPPPPVHQAT